jgi:hypothetical protein
VPKPSSDRVDVDASAQKVGRRGVTDGMGTDALCHQRWGDAQGDGTELNNDGAGMASKKLHEPYAPTLAENARNVSSYRRTRPIEARRCSLRLGLKVTHSRHYQRVPIIVVKTLPSQATKGLARLWQYGLPANQRWPRDWHGGAPASGLLGRRERSVSKRSEQTR